MSLSVTVDYFPKSGKTGDALTELFMQHLRILQMYQSCTMRAKSDRLIISDYSNCVSFCQNCFNSNKICFECKALGHVSVYPPSRECQNCINKKQRCIKRAILIITTDCEEGNTKMFINLKKKTEEKNIDPYHALVDSLPGAPHLPKSLKASFCSSVQKFYMILFLLN